MRATRAHAESAETLKRRAGVGRIAKDRTPLMQREDEHSRFVNRFPVGSFGRPAGALFSLIGKKIEWLVPQPISRLWLRSGAFDYERRTAYRNLNALV